MKPKIDNAKRTAERIFNTVSLGYSDRTSGAV